MCRLGIYGARSAPSGGGTTTAPSGVLWPDELGPWWMAAQTFIRWSQLNVWERLLARV